ncbi:MAG: ATP-dependent Clp protease proteolytic subunit [Candidatus Saccharibacteria bacterium]|nr:ATP-dependent Clp protease proteolytic subunit [Candidatus Saccharibacteria bacterium]
MSKKSINPNQILIPTVIEQEANGTRVYDIYSRLLEGRIVFLGSLINNDVANLIVAQLLFLEQKESTDDIYLYINSPGGSVSAGMAIFDTMNYIKADVHTICVGQAASMGAFLLANGTSGKRSILPHAKVMLHQPWADGITGQVTDIEITTKELLKTKQLLNKILADKTGQSLDKLQAQVERDYWLDAKEAQKYGLVDNILNQRLIPSKKK